MPNSNNNIVIPEAVIFQTVKAALEHIRTDFSEKPEETKTFLYRAIQSQNSIQRYDMYQQAKTVFLSAPNPNEPRYLDVSMGFDTDRIQKKMPTIHIILQSENPKDDSLGMGEGNVPFDFEDYFDPEDPPIDPEAPPIDPITGSYNPKYVRRFSQQVNLMITGDNSNEKVLIYWVLRSVLIAFTPYFNELGFDNVSFSGGDIQINMNTSSYLYVRNLSIRFDYDAVVPQVMDLEFIRRILFTITVTDDG